MSLGYDNYDAGVRKPSSVNEARQEELFYSFIDCYGIIPTGTTFIDSYVQKNYSKKISY